MTAPPRRRLPPLERYESHLPHDKLALFPRVSRRRLLALAERFRRPPARPLEAARWRPGR